MKMLTTKEYAQYAGITHRAAIKRISSGKIEGVTTTVGKSNKKEYLIPINALNDYQHLDYIRDHSPELYKAMCPERKRAPSLDLWSEKDREQIVFWQGVVKEWLDFRDEGLYSGRYQYKHEADEDFVAYCKVKYPKVVISTQVLCKKYRAIKANDFEALINHQGRKRKDFSKIPDVAWEAFLSFYLDENQHPIKRCYEYTKLYLQDEAPEYLDGIAHFTTFYRRAQKDISEGVKVLGREGEKAFNDRCAPYIKRVYDHMLSNEYWVADNHTFDVITMGENGKTHRLYLTAFFDARSGIFTGCYVALNPSSQATLVALRKGILKYGIPDNIYVDNGREFLTYDIGGLGHRAKKPKNEPERFDPPPIFNRLGINMVNAIVRNAKAKIIERRFRDIKDQLSRLFETYVGGNVCERPEKLKKVLKDGKITSDKEFAEAIEELLEWWFNQQEYGGSVEADRGKSRMQVYNENLKIKRVASPDELHLMLMRSSRAQMVGRRGVHLKVGNQRIDYFSDELLATMLRKQVYFRYDPDNLSEIRIYDLEDRFLMTVPADSTAVLEYGASKEELKAAMKKTRSFEKITKEAVRISQIPRLGKKTAFELVLADAMRKKNGEGIKPISSQLLEVHRAKEEPLLKQAVGAPVDMDLMLKNAKRKREEEK